MTSDRDMVIVMWGGPCSGKSVLKGMLINRYAFADPPEVVTGRSYFTEHYADEVEGIYRCHMHPEQEPWHALRYGDYVLERIAGNKGTILVEDFPDEPEMHKAVLALTKESDRQLVFMGQICDPLYLAWRLQTHPPKEKAYKPEMLPEILKANREKILTINDTLGLYRGSQIATIMGETTLYMEYRWEPLAVYFPRLLYQFLSTSRWERLVEGWRTFRHVPGERYEFHDFSREPQVIHRDFSGHKVKRIIEALIDDTMEPSLSHVDSVKK